MARKHGFIPGASPPLHKTPIFIALFSPFYLNSLFRRDRRRQASIFRLGAPRSARPILTDCNDLSGDVNPPPGRQTVKKRADRRFFRRIDAFPLF
jgi:hypothetical protein